MQCPSCHFQNLPGSELCGRCATSLLLAASELDVYPPRARDRGGLIRRISLFVQGVFRRLGEDLHLMRGDQLNWKLPPGGFFNRILIPGLSHLHVGQRLKGWMYLASFLVVLVFSLLYMGTAWSGILLGTAFSIHSTAALDVLLQLAPPAGMKARIVASFAISALIFGLLYLPVIFLQSQVASPREMREESYPFKAGDVVLINSWSRPRVGQMVLYDLPVLTEDVTQPGHRRMLVRFYGERMDRIIAGPNQTVIWENQALTIDGEPSNLRPMRPEIMPARLELRVPAEHYLIFPTTTPFVGPRTSRDSWEKMSLVPADSVHGRPYFQTRPLSHAGRIK